MAIRNMTFSVPESLAVQLKSARLQDRDLALISACEIANEDPDVAEIEREFDGIGDVVAEPWK